MAAMTQTATIKNTKALEKYIEQANLAGMPSNQVERFIRSGYIALPKMTYFHAIAREADRGGGPIEIGMGGARGPGKSHAALAQIGLDDCQRYEGVKFLFLRKLAKSAQESFEDLIQKLFTYTEHNYIPSRNKLEFPNGSSIVLGGFNNESEIDKYLGIEYDGLGLEEATQISKRKYDMLMGSIRTSKPGWRVRKYLTTNPGGIGHAWFKEKFVMPHRMGTEQFTRFIPSTYKDNPFLSPDYVYYLESLEGGLGKAWRDGDWDVFEGMAFPQWDYERHTCEPFQIPTHWPKWRAVDWGYSAPFCGLWVARNLDNQRIFVYREVYGPGFIDVQQARMIRENTATDEMIKATFMDPAMWSRNRQDKDGKVYSTADTYQDEGIFPNKADNDRLGGKRKVDRMLGNLPDGDPGIVIFRNCKNTIRTIPELIYDAHRPEDVDTTQEDHAYDALRYLLTDIKEQKPAQKQQANPFMQLKGW